MLQQFNIRGNELTWNSDGVIFVDQTSIPNSNIFHLFPYLFKSKRPKDLQGFDDFIEKIESMGLTHLVQVKTKIISGSNATTTTTSKSNSQNWWYLD